jgi:hypothetical protein
MLFFMLVVNFITGAGQGLLQRRVVIVAVCLWASAKSWTPPVPELELCIILHQS